VDDDDFWEYGEKKHTAAAAAWVHTSNIGAATLGRMTLKKVTFDI
jgi:hypothetical protein